MKDLKFQEGGHPVRKNDFETLKSRSDSSLFSLLKGLGGSLTATEKVAIVLDINTNYIPHSVTQGGYTEVDITVLDAIIYFLGQFYSIPTQTILNISISSTHDSEDAYQSAFNKLCFIFPQDNNWEVDSISSPVEYENGEFKNIHFNVNGRVSIIGNSEIHPADYDPLNDKDYVLFPTCLFLKDLGKGAIDAFHATPVNIVDTLVKRDLDGSVVLGALKVTGSRNDVPYSGLEVSQGISASEIKLNKHLQLINAASIQSVDDINQCNIYFNFESGVVRRLYASAYENGGSYEKPLITFTDSACPYLYLKYNNEEIFYCEIIENQNGIYNNRESFKIIDSSYIQNKIFSIKIKEEKEEITYLEYIFLEIDGTIIKPSNYIFGEKYTVLRQGESLELNFSIEREVKEVKLISKGYYINLK